MCQRTADSYGATESADLALLAYEVYNNLATTVYIYISMVLLFCNCLIFSHSWVPTMNSKRTLLKGMKLIMTLAYEERGRN